MDQSDVGSDRLFAIRFGQGELENVIAGWQFHHIKIVRQAGIVKERSPVGRIRIAGVGFPQIGRQFDQKTHETKALVVIVVIAVAAHP